MAIRAQLGAADGPGGLEAVHDRHVEVHEDGVVRGPGDGLHGLTAVDDEVCGETQMFEHAQGHLLVHDVVLGDEDPGGVAPSAPARGGVDGDRRGGDLGALTHLRELVVELGG